jgi:hypothetical protein
MNVNGNFNNGPPTALMSYPFPVHNPTQHPSLMEQTYQNQVHVQNKHTLVLTLNLIDVRNTLIECERVLILHMHRFHFQI